MLHGQAMRLIGKLDGISQLLPDHDFFLLMFVRKMGAPTNDDFWTGLKMNFEVHVEAHD